ncbi:MAG: hypothetical protein DI628_06115 [Blastochloris viridis]|uniref:Uncharacterized protein n=1 Tax=Blastochloris viridis TaxID=1079 RepID=A0A6N4QYF2_BLAVI|nr:MAG: hypothetical protein DI628_06115 [Blastochloris viridis]
MNASTTINVSALQEMGDAAYFRLQSSDPRLPRTLRGKTISAVRLAKMALYSVMILKAADQDEIAARNELTMAKTTKNPVLRQQHLTRANVLRLQAIRRRNVSEARLEAILGAVAL